MKNIEFDVELTVRDLYAFSMRHTYAGVSGIFGLLISLGSWLICAIQFDSLDGTARAALFIIGCLFTVVQPVMLYFKARTQVRQNKNINAALHYILSEEGVTVSQGEQEAFVKWDEVRKKVQTKKAIYLYMSPVRAFIFPESQCGGAFEQVCELTGQQLEKHREDCSAEDGREDQEG